MKGVDDLCIKGSGIRGTTINVLNSNCHHRVKRGDGFWVPFADPFWKKKGKTFEKGNGQWASGEKSWGSWGSKTLTVDDQTSSASHACYGRGGGVT